jgi:hypothetical protein
MGACWNRSVGVGVKVKIDERNAVGKSHCVTLKVDVSRPEIYYISQSMSLTYIYVYGVKQKDMLR